MSLSPARSPSLIQIHVDCDSIPGMLTVVHVIAVSGVVDVHVIVVVPIVRPVFRPWVNDTEPKAAILEPGVPTRKNYWETVKPEPVNLAEGVTETVVGNTVTVVAASLLPPAVLGLPAPRAILKPHATPVTFLDKVQVDADGDAILRIPSVVQVIAVPTVVDDLLP
jgi:hypothetical protein